MLVQNKRPKKPSRAGVRTIIYGGASYGLGILLLILGSVTFVAVSAVALTTLFMGVVLLILGVVEVRRYLRTRTP